MHDAIFHKSPRSRPDTILMTLEALYLQARDVLSLEKITVAESRLLAEIVVHLKRLLLQWADAESKLSQNRQLLEAIGALQEKYLELEGTVKERRNSLLAKRQSPV